ncbi:MAG TPA: hypothetical protein VGH98_17270 [Gemmatimonadaceae bacterium]
MSSFGCVRCRTLAAGNNYHRSSPCLSLGGAMTDTHVALAEILEPGS